MVIGTDRSVSFQKNHLLFPVGICAKLRQEPIHPVNKEIDVGLDFINGRSNYLNL